jgi:hypothetical protein
MAEHCSQLQHTKAFQTTGAGRNFIFTVNVTCFGVTIIAVDAKVPTINGTGELQGFVIDSERTRVNATI